MYNRCKYCAIYAFSRELRTTVSYLLVKTKTNTYEQSKYTNEWNTAEEN